MTRQELLIRLSDRTSCDQKICESVISTFFDLVAQVLAKDGKMTLRGVGRFETAKFNPTRVGNLNGPGTVHVPARTIVRFKAAPGFESKMLEKATNE